MESESDPSFMKQELYINYCFEVLEHLGDTHQVSIEFHIKLNAYILKLIDTQIFKKRNIQ